MYFTLVCRTVLFSAFISLQLENHINFDKFSMSTEMFSCVACVLINRESMQEYWKGITCVYIILFNFIIWASNPLLVIERGLIRKLQTIHSLFYSHFTIKNIFWIIQISVWFFSVDSLNNCRRFYFTFMFYFAQLYLLL